MKLHIKKNQDLSRMKVIITAVVAVLLFVLISNILRFMSSFIEMDTASVGIIVRMIIIFVAISAVLATWFQDKYEQYNLEDNKLIITRGFLSARKQIVTLNPSSVSNLDLSQPFFGGMLHYGTIRIEINNFGGKETYFLRNIDRPEKAFTEIQQHIQNLK